MKNSKIIIPQSEVELRNIIQSIVELTTTSVLSRLGLLKPYISLKEAYDAYGWGTVERWCSEGLVKKIKDGEGSSPVRINRVEIESVAKASNRTEWYINKYKK
ncbi:MAG: hypothetical protein LBJ63_12025 [Prevotellaceae bacterium]|jgi:hypothetical protein|nr:hypothetical protein [Prevotellaceae bacterium]